MIVTDLLAAELILPFDYEKIKSEMLKLKKFWRHTPPYKLNIDQALAGLIFKVESDELYKKIDYIDNNDKIVHVGMPGQHIFYLRESNANPTAEPFKLTKMLPTESWDWIPAYKDIIPYTIECIESLPYRSIGCIRVFVTENTFFPTHRDFGVGGPAVLSSDYPKILGLSIVPDTGDVPMSIYSYKNKEVYKVSGNAMIFNDSAFHGVSYTSGMRITIRVFGDIDFQDFLPYINTKQVFY